MFTGGGWSTHLELMSFDWNALHGSGVWVHDPVVAAAEGGTCPHGAQFRRASVLLPWEGIQFELELRLCEGWGGVSIHSGWGFLWRGASVDAQDGEWRCWQLLPFIVHAVRQGVRSVPWAICSGWLRWQEDVLHSRGITFRPLQRFWERITDHSKNDKTRGQQNSLLHSLK